MGELGGELGPGAPYVPSESGLYLRTLEATED